MVEETQTALERWVSRTQWPLAGCAVCFLVLYSVEVLGQPPDWLGRTISWLLMALYMPFVVDYVVRLALAENRLRWFVRHPLELAVVTLPFLQPLRFLRLIPVVRTLHGVFGNPVRGGVIAFTALAAVLLVYVSALAQLSYERTASDAQIKTFADALWWSVATITTVGYGDFTPVTGGGRVIAVFLMIGGITLIGVITGTVAHWIVDQVSADDKAQQAATVAHIEDLQDEIIRLRELVSERVGGGDAVRSEWTNTGAR